jgi:hypothetical protein
MACVLPAFSPVRFMKTLSGQNNPGIAGQAYVPKEGATLGTSGAISTDSTIQITRKGPGYVLMLLRQERLQRQTRGKTFHGKFRCSVLLASD